jgi:hypothetical protein
LTEERVTSSTGGQKGTKDDKGFWLIPFELLSLFARVWEFGASKYTPINWRKGYDWHLNFDAMHRHIGAFWGGELIDPESGLPHLMHAAWHCFVLTFFSMNEKYAEFDDRPVTLSMNEKTDSLASFQFTDADGKVLKGETCYAGPNGFEEDCPACLAFRR